MGDVSVAEQDLSKTMTDESAKNKAQVLFETARKTIDSPTPLITDKNIIPPSGDKKDFVSLSPYWHRTKDGSLIYKDGEVNPEVENYPDPQNLGKVAGNILIASIAAEFTEDPAERERLANYAVSTIKDWFVDDKTRMTPSLEYAQTKQGETTGNFYGIIEGNRLIHVIEGVNNLKVSGLIDSDTLRGVEGWFDQYLNWLLTSEKGKQEKAMSNNHGTFYDVQVAYIADFLAKSDLSRETITSVKERIKSQINPNGEMPLEAERAIPYDYQLYNLYALSQLASLSQRYNIDLWNWETGDGRGLRKALEYFVGQLKNAGDEPFKMDRSSEFYLTFRAASKAYDNAAYWDLPKKFYEDPLVDEATKECSSNKSKTWLHFFHFFSYLSYQPKVRESLKNTG